MWDRRINEDDKCFCVGSELFIGLALSFYFLSGYFYVAENFNVHVTISDSDYSAAPQKKDSCVLESSRSKAKLSRLIFAVLSLDCFFVSFLLDLALKVTFKIRVLCNYSGAILE